MDITMLYIYYSVYLIKDKHYITKYFYHFVLLLTNLKQLLKCFFYPILKSLINLYSIMCDH